MSKPNIQLNIEEFNNNIENTLDYTEKSSQLVEIDSMSRFTKSQRILILLLISITGTTSPISSAIYLPALLSIKSEFHTTEELVDISVSIFLFITAIAPLLWGNLADLYGRKGVYISSVAIFVGSSVGCALAADIYLLIIMRALQGLGSSASLVIGVGVITDIFPRHEIGSALGLFLVGPLIGPVIGPIIGGFISQYLGWRYIFWILTVLASIIFICVTFFLPETLAPSSKSAYPFKITLKPFSISRNGPMFNPFEPLFFLKYVTIALTTLYASFIFASYFCISTSQVKFLISIYNLNASQVGLCYISLGSGNLIGSILGGKLSDFLLTRYTKKTEGQCPPEVRLYGSFIGAISITVGLFMLGWFIEYKLSLGLVLFSQFLIGFGMTFAFSGTSTYVIDLFPRYSSTISACNNCLRTIAAGIVVSFNSNMLDGLGYGWSFSLFGFLNFVGIIILIILIIFGIKIRAWENKKY